MIYHFNPPRTLQDVANDLGKAMKKLEEIKGPKEVESNINPVFNQIFKPLIKIK